MDFFYLPTCDGKIWKLSYSGEYQVVDSFQVPDDMAGLNQIVKIDEWYYLTIYHGMDFDQSKPSKIIRAKQIEHFAENKYEDLTEILGITGTPYFLSQIDDKWFLTEIHSSSGITSFDIVNGEIKNVKKIYYFPKVSKSLNAGKKRFLKSIKKMKTGR